MTEDISPWIILHPGIMRNNTVYNKQTMQQRKFETSFLLSLGQHLEYKCGLWQLQLEEKKRKKERLLSKGHD